MRTFCATLFVVAMIAPASAYTDEQVSACTPDVMRLCSDAIPDEGRIIKCMIQKKAQRDMHDGYEEGPVADITGGGQVNADSLPTFTALIGSAPASIDAAISQQLLFLLLLSADRRTSLYRRLFAETDLRFTDCRGGLQAGVSKQHATLARMV